jgi:hypothetical protein
MKCNLLDISGSVHIPTGQFKYFSNRQAQYQQGTEYFFYSVIPSWVEEMNREEGMETGRDMIHNVAPKIICSPQIEVLKS